MNATATPAQTINARIVSTFFGVEDHGITTAMIDLDYGSSQQSFGGYGLDEYDKGKKRRVATAFGMAFLTEILRVLEVRQWEKLPGTFCRVRTTHTKVEAIGHPLKDQWFNPAELTEEYKNV